MSALHGTAIAREGRGVLLVGKSGSGKSSIALQLMALGADLLADDGVLIGRTGAGLLMKCPKSIEGMIEARGIGLISVPSVSQAGLVFVVDLDKTAAMRLPEPETQTILGIDVPLIRGRDAVNLSAVIWCLLGEGRLSSPSGS